MTTCEYSLHVIEPFFSSPPTYQHQHQSTLLFETKYSHLHIPCPASFCLLPKPRALLTADIDFVFSCFLGATVSGESPVRIAKAEETLRKNNVDQHETQEAMTPGLRALIVALRVENDIQEQIHHKHRLVARKEEEIHRYKPCGTWGRCAVCRGDADDGDKRNAKYPLYQWKLLLKKPEDRDPTRRDDRPEVVKYFQEGWDENVFNLVYGAEPEGGIFAKFKQALTGLW